MGVLVNVMAMSEGRLRARGRDIVRACRARVVMLSKADGVTTTAVVPFHMTKWSKAGLLLLDGHGRPTAKESFRDGRSNAQVHMDIWPEGPKRQGKYVNPIEQFARRDWPGNLASGDKARRPMFRLGSQQDIADEFAMRLLVDPKEIRHPEPEELISSQCRLLQKGRFELLPPVLRLEGGEKRYLKAVHSGGVLNRIRKGCLEVRFGKNTRAFPIPEGMAVNARLKVGRRIERGQEFFRLNTDLDGLAKLDIAQVLVDSISNKMYHSDHGRQLVRLKYASEVAHYCLRCGKMRGIYPITSLLCPTCGRRVDSPRQRGGQHLRFHEVKPDTCLECVSCETVATTDRFRQHRVCRDCGAAAVPALKRVYAMCNTRHYDVSAELLGRYLPNPGEISFVKSYLRRLRKEGRSLEDVVGEAEARRVRLPAMHLVA